MGAPPIKGLLLDLSGTLYVGTAAVEGARDAVKALTAAGYPLLYVTNTTSKPRSAVVEKLASMGFAITPEEVLTAPLAGAEGLLARGHTRCQFLLPEPVLADLPGMTHDAAEPEAVVVGDIGEAFDYGILNRAFRNIMEGASLYALAKNRYFTDDNGLRLDVGPFVRALEYAADTRAELLGKPAAAFFLAAAAKLGLPPGSVAMVGDDIEGDVGGAIAAGMRGILVRTGKYRRAAAEAAEITPDADLASVAALPDFLATGQSRAPEPD